MLGRHLSPVWKLAVAFAAVLAVLPARAGAQDQASIVVNGDFEVPVVSNYQPFYPPGFDAWTVDAGSVDIVHELWAAASGVQSVDLNGNCCDPGSILQNLPTTTGAGYVLSFSFAGNPDPNPICLTSPVIKRMEVFWGETSVGVFVFDTTGHTLADPGWQAVSLPVTANASTTTLRFTSLIPGACGPALDDVAVTPRPGVPTGKEQCKHGGWKQFGVKNHGRCIRFVIRGPKR
jgi:choice-of-anchor C domain-containing protein